MRFIIAVGLVLGFALPAAAQEATNDESACAELREAAQQVGRSMLPATRRSEIERRLRSDRPIQTSALPPDARAKIEAEIHGLEAQIKADDELRQRRDELAAVAEANAACIAANEAVRARDDANRKAAADRAAAEAAAKQAEVDRQNAETARQDAEMRAIMSNPTFTRAALSTWVCIEDLMRAKALAAIRDEKKYAQVGGVQDNRKLYDLQNDVRSSDEAKARYLAVLKGVLKTSAIGCSAPVVKATVACVISRDEQDAVDSQCLEGKLAGPVKAALFMMHSENMAQ